MKLRIRHGAITIWTTLGTVTDRLSTVRAWMAGLLSRALVADLSGCEQKQPSAAPASTSSGHSIVVFAATLLKPAFTLLAGKFQTDNPRATIDFDFATSSG